MKNKVFGIDVVFFSVLYGRTYGIVEWN